MNRKSTKKESRLGIRREKRLMIDTDIILNCTRPGEDVKETAGKQRFLIPCVEQPVDMIGRRDERIVDGTLRRDVQGSEAAAQKRDQRERCQECRQQAGNQGQR